MVVVSFQERDNRETKDRYLQEKGVGTDAQGDVVANAVTSSAFSAAALPGILQNTIVLVPSLAPCRIQLPAAIKLN